MLFAELTYTLATEEAERIGVDHVARMTATGSGENSTGKEGAFSAVGLQSLATFILHVGLFLSPCSGRAPDRATQRH